MVDVAAPSAGLPKLRSEIVRSQQDGVVVLKDPASGRFFRFGEAEDFIASQLDGVTPVEILRQRVRERFGTEPAPGAVEGFIATLRRVGLLEAEGGPAAPAPAGARPFRGSLLYLRLKAFDPDRLLDRLVGHVGVFFTPGFVVLAAAVILLGLAVSIANGAEIARDLLAIYRVEMVLVAWLTIFAVTTLHEFAHALTCKRFGGHVHEMGFLLLYFQLAFYTNVSDAWLFPEKSRRLWVTWAGPYFEMFLWALAVLAWRVTEPGTWLSAVALVVVATSGFKLFINLNPLIKLDGYYLLCDFLGTPNLRARAFGYLRGRLGALWGSADRALAEATPRERRIYVSYGLLAGGYSAWLLSYIAWVAGGYLVDRYQGTGAVVSAGLLMVMFQNPLKRWARAPARVRAWWGRLGSVSRPLKISIVLAAGLAVLVLGRLELTVSGDFAVAPHHNADVRAEVDGLITEVVVDEGQRVAAGDLIARLADRDYRAELEAVEGQIAETGARLRLLQAGPRAEEIQLARQAVETARTRREHAQRRWHEAEGMLAARMARAKAEVEKAEERQRYGRSDLARVKALFAADLVSRREFEEAQERVAVREGEAEAARAELRTVQADDLAETRKELAVAQQEVQEAQARLRVLLAGSRPEEIQGAEAALQRLGAQRAHVREQLHLVEIRSPVAGVVTTPKPREMVGQYLKKGDLIVEVHELAVISAEIAVPEKEVGDVRVGQPVVVKARAFPGTSFAGRVTAIAPAAVKDQAEPWRGRTVRVTTEIENPELRLRPEMTGMAKIYCGERRIGELVTRRLARYVRVEVWSWWWW
jgi:multidrug resistance efflux pump